MRAKKWVFKLILILFGMLLLEIYPAEYRHARGDVSTDGEAVIKSFCDRVVVEMKAMNKEMGIDEEEDMDAVKEECLSGKDIPGTRDEFIAIAASVMSDCGDMSSVDFLMCLGEIIQPELHLEPEEAMRELDDDLAEEIDGEAVVKSFCDRVVVEIEAMNKEMGIDEEEDMDALKEECMISKDFPGTRDDFIAFAGKAMSECGDKNSMDFMLCMGEIANEALPVEDLGEEPSHREEKGKKEPFGGPIIEDFCDRAFIEFVAMGEEMGLESEEDSNEIRDGCMSGEGFTGTKEDYEKLVQTVMSKCGDMKSMDFMMCLADEFNEAVPPEE